MRWSRTLFLLFLVAAPAFWMEYHLAFSAPCLFLLLACESGWTCPARQVPLLWWAAGMVRDLTIGLRLGTSALVFLLLGQALLTIRCRLRGSHPAARPTVAIFFVVVLRLTEPLLAWGSHGLATSLDEWKAIAASACLTGGLACLGPLCLRPMNLVTPSASEAPFLERGA